MPCDLWVADRIEAYESNFLKVEDSEDFTEISKF